MEQREHEVIPQGLTGRLKKKPIFNMLIGIFLLAAAVAIGIIYFPLSVALLVTVILLGVIGAGIVLYTGVDFYVNKRRIRMPDHPPQALALALALALAPAQAQAQAQALNPTDETKVSVNHQKPEPTFESLFKEIYDKLCQGEEIKEGEFTRLKELGKSANLLEKFDTGHGETTYLETVLNIPLHQTVVNSELDESFLYFKCLEDEKTRKKLKLMDCVLEIFEENWELYETNLEFLNELKRIFRNYRESYLRISSEDIARIAITTSLTRFAAYFGKLNFSIPVLSKDSNIEYFFTKELMGKESFNLMYFYNLKKNQTYLEFVLEHYSNNEDFADTLLCSLFSFKDEKGNQSIFAKIEYSFDTGKNLIKNLIRPAELKIKGYSDRKPRYNLTELNNAKKIMEEYRRKSCFFQNCFDVLNEYIDFIERSVVGIFPSVLKDPKKVQEKGAQLQRWVCEGKIDLITCVMGEKSYLLLTLEHYKENPALLLWILSAISTIKEENEGKEQAKIENLKVELKKLKEIEKIFDDFLKQESKPSYEEKTKAESLQLIITKYQEIKSRREEVEKKVSCLEKEIEFEKEFLKLYKGQKTSITGKKLFELGKNIDVLKEVEGGEIKEGSYLKAALTKAIDSGDYDFVLVILGILREDCLNNEKKGEELEKICEIMDKFIPTLDRVIAEKKEGQTPEESKKVRKLMVCLRGAKFRAMFSSLHLLPKEDKNYKGKKKELIEFCSKFDFPFLTTICKKASQEKKEVNFFEFMMNSAEEWEELIVNGNLFVYSTTTFGEKIERRTFIDSGGSPSEKSVDPVYDLETLISFRAFFDKEPPITYSSKLNSLKEKIDLYILFIQKSFLEKTLSLSLTENLTGDLLNNVEMAMTKIFNRDDDYGVCYLLSALNGGEPFIWLIRKLLDELLTLVDLEKNTFLYDISVLEKAVKTIQNFLLKYKGDDEYKRWLIEALKVIEETMYLNRINELLRLLPEEDENYKEKKEALVKFLPESNLPFLSLLCTCCECKKEESQCEEKGEELQKEKGVNIFKLLLKSGEKGEELILNSNLFVYSAKTREENIETKTFEQDAEVKENVESIWPVYDLETLISFRAFFDKETITYSPKLNSLKEKIDLYILFMKSFLERTLSPSSTENQQDTVSPSHSP